MSSAAPDLASTARETAERLTDDQALVARALLDLGAAQHRGDDSAPRGVILGRLRATAVGLAGDAPIGVQRIRRALYALGASSTRYDGADERVERVSPVRLVYAYGGQGGASPRRFRLTPYGVEVLEHRRLLDGLGA